MGESGCGKTTTGRCILRLERPTAGEILYDGVDIAKLERKELLALRRRIQVIFQDPYSSLNPRMKVGDIIGEPLKVHGIEPERRTFGEGARTAVGLRPQPISPTGIRTKCQAVSASASALPVRWR